MPRYVYKCDACSGQFEISHGMFFELERCELCNSDYGLFKIPCFNIKATADTTPNKPKPGSVVEKHIKDARDDLKKEKKKLEQELYDS